MNIFKSTVHHLSNFLHFLHYEKSNSILSGFCPENISSGMVYRNRAKDNVEMFNAVRRKNVDGRHGSPSATQLLHLGPPL